MNLTIDDWAKIVLVVTALLQLLKPLLEKIPGMRPDDSQHDTLLRLVAFLLSLGAVLYLGATQGGLDWHNAGQYLYFTLQQFLSTQGAYGVVKLSGTALANRSKATALVPVQSATLAPANAPAMPGESTHLTDSVPADVLAQYTGPNAETISAV